MTSNRYARTTPLLLSALVCLGFWACTPEPKLSRLSDNAVILAFGDSITYGTGAAASQSYPAVLETLTRRRVVNAGVPGEVSAEGLVRLPDVLAQNKPDLLILCHGGNDLLRGLDLQQTKRNLKAMIKIAKEKNVAVILIAVPAPGIFLKPPALYEEIADDQRIPLEENILETILSNGKWKADYIHPNAAGYSMMADAIRDLLQKTDAL